MKKIFLTLIVIGAAIFTATPAQCKQSTKTSRYHHELRGTILKVNPAKAEFTIKTYHGEVVECLMNAKTVVKNSDGKRIHFREVRAGDRAYCHCDAMRDGKHYSVYLLVKERRGKHDK